MTTEKSTRNYKIPGLTWLGLLLYVAVYELWAIVTKHPTLSQWVWHTDGHFPWFRYLVLAGISFLMYHFFWQKH